MILCTVKYEKPLQYLSILSEATNELLVYLYNTKICERWHVNKSNTYQNKV